MVEVPPCEFKLGEEDDAHAVRADAFKIGKFPVTNLYHRFVRDADHSPPSLWVEGKVPLSLEDHPVVNVTWDDAVAYCDWMSSVSGTKYRLPTEVEWELTARGHEGTIYPWGDTFFAECCNCWEMAVGWTTPVNCFAEGISSFGALDLVGNVWEWCSTLYADYPYDPDDGREESGVDGWKVLRGGSWLDHEWGVRAARRLSGDPERGSHNTGFRVVSSI